jgi:Zn-dependent M28 family amino/carboxypeptidase
VSVTIDNTFEVISEQVSHNVVGMVEGTDPALNGTYGMLGAHLDGVGASETGESAQPSAAGCRPRMPRAVDAIEAAGRTAQNPQSVNSAGVRGGAGRGAGRGGRDGRGAAVVTPAPWDQRDVINNAADDDGSGSVALMAIARALATGPKPKRSMVFIWHTGEERGLLGSSCNVDFPVVPLDKVQAFITMDAIGRDDCDSLEGDHSNTLFIIGADRISTDLHNILVLTNEEQMAPPLTLDYENNDPADPAGAYGRADHFNYAARGIPVAFLSTGLHQDYHRATDTADKIVFPKMARIAQFVYQAGFGIANSDAALVRDNKGPRTGFGSKAVVIR